MSLFTPTPIVTIRKLRVIFALVFTLWAALSTRADVSISVNPSMSASIGGELSLKRSKYINLGDIGSNLEAKRQDPERVDYYINELGMKFGREFGGIYHAVNWSNGAVREDPERPGHVDIEYLKDNLVSSYHGASESFQDRFAPNLGRAAHDRADAYPDFMESYSDGGNPGHRHPSDVEAAAEFVAAMLEYRYNDWTRPKTYEIVNEPDWRVYGDQRFADLHTAINEAVDEAGLDVLVGGPCMSVGYFYKNRYQQFSMREFIDNTECSLDFYSFHIYDYMSWDADSQDFVGRVSTGLPIEGVLDLIQNYTLNEYGKGVKIVLSEHGGYISGNKEAPLDEIANAYFPGSGFEWEMKRRSISDFIGVSSMIANTMAFMNNPHVIQKSVPFIILESAAWDPRYYSTLLVKENFDRTSDVWHESTNINFFKFFKNVVGRRVRIDVSDPDIQNQAYVERNKLFVLLNNLADKEESLDLDVPLEGVSSITLRRFGRIDDFTPYFTESVVTGLQGIEMAGREAIAIEIEYESIIEETQRVDEVPLYAAQIQQSFTGTRTFDLVAPNHQDILYAKLRIGVGRSPGTDRDMTVSVNGNALAVPLEDCAAYLEDDSDYGSIKLVDVPVNFLQENNQIEIGFPNNGSGGIGSVVLRAAYEYAAQDQDGDGHSDEQEQVAGTDPEDYNSYLKVSIMSESGEGRHLIEWEPEYGRSYAILYKDTSEDTNYKVLATGLRYPQREYTVTDMTGSGTRFYKVSVIEE